MLTSIAIYAMAAIVSMFGLVALKAAAEYRFQGKTSLTIEGISFLSCAVYGAFLATNPVAFGVLGLGIAAGVGIRQIKGNEQRYIE